MIGHESKVYISAMQKKFLSFYKLEVNLFYILGPEKFICVLKSYEFYL